MKKEYQTTPFLYFRLKLLDFRQEERRDERHRQQDFFSAGITLESRDRLRAEKEFAHFVRKMAEALRVHFANIFVGLVQRHLRIVYLKDIAGKFEKFRIDFNHDILVVL